MEIYTTKLDNRVIMGKYSYISSNKINIWWAPPESRIIIGNFFSISSDLTIFLGGNHNVNWTTTFPFGHRNADIYLTTLAEKDILLQTEPLLLETMYI